jgi:hypothetical protein
VTLNTDRYRAILAAGDDLTLADCHDLLGEIDRLRAANGSLRGLMATTLEWLVERSMRPSCECDPSELVTRLTKEIEP